MSSTGRALLAAVVTVLASVAMLATLLAHYANAFADSSGFASRTVTVVQSGPVESLIAGTITSRLVDEIGGRADVQPMVAEGVREALSSPQITGEIRVAAETLQSQLVSGDAHALTLTLPGIGPATASRLESRSPQLAAAFSRVGTITVLDVGIPSSAAAAIHDLAVAGQDSTLLIVFTIAVIALALILSPDRRRTFVGLGVGAVASGLLAVAIYLAGRALVVDEFSSPAASTAAHAAWSAYLGGLESSGLVLAAAGAVVAVAAMLARRNQQQHWNPQY